ncbi:MAG: family 43 glycosylhydrolase [Kiritimatiellae bacterium]|nr:family 43 glycosylhydrolase [Kiritimatiellia bacterium]MBQ3344946.1 family 43 glycosylhydrolase [Kiritimatiellia bacterium]MBQ6329465.1 family 43 glycosylhydrolase [Kiritimatiellia bacterium]
MRTAVFSLTFVAMLSAKAGGIAYENPVWRQDSPDPTVWQAGGVYYETSTSQRILESRDLVRWTDTGHRLLEQSEYDWIAQVWPHVWAPDVIKIGEWYNLYLTVHNGGAHTAIIAYRSKCPTGPFKDRQIILRSEDDGRFEVIDAEVVKDPQSGRVWLFFGHGDLRRLELAVDGRGRRLGAKVEHVAGLALGNPAWGKDDERHGAEATEGAYLHFREGWWYLFVSIGNWQNHTYRLAVGRSRTLDGKFFDRRGRSMADGYATVILSSEKGDEFFGPGHNGEIFTTKSGKTYIFYHCHWKGGPADEHSATVWSGADYVPRPLFLQEIFWGDDGWPYFGNGGKPQKNCVFVN